DEDAGVDLQALNDNELLFVNGGPPSTAVIPAVDIQGAIAMTSQKKKKKRKSFQHWQNSDDKILTVSLANWGLLCKFRDTEAEDLISGKGYSARLCRQFERIYP
ncbi:hypothetical protein HOY80DRAFT_866440, partial [Tuber brumale]